jgi:hypothetical protein
MKNQRKPNRCQALNKDGKPCGAAAMPGVRWNPDSDKHRLRAATAPQRLPALNSNTVTL